MAWNWTLPNWPDFRYDASALEAFEQTFLLSSGEILGAVHHVSQPEREQLRIELLSEEAMQTSAIEGEILDRLISLKNSSLIDDHLPDSLPLVDGRINDVGTETGSAGSTFL
jgi:Fic family protein